MRFGRAAALAVLLLLASALVVATPATATTHETVAGSTSVTGNITGPTVLAYNANHYYNINATGGPAFAANGTLVGNVTFYASVTGENTTGVNLVPSESAITNSSGHPTLLTVTNITELLTLVVEISSTYLTENESINLTYPVNVVQPYILSLTLLSQTSSTILAFTLTVYLDGAPVGSIHIPTLTGKQSYVATFQYATTGLSSGEHTFTVSLVNEHGLITFAGGAPSYSTSFYVPGPPPDYTLWYVTGAVAFFGAIFIFVTRVAARRRNPTRK